MAEKQNSPTIISAASARQAARWFNYGNLLAVILPIPFSLLWFGGSIIVFALNRHHPNPRVGYYTQQAAYRFYAIVGVIVVVGTLFDGGLRNWLISWAVAAAILIPWSVLDLVRIAREPWQDHIVSGDDNHAPHP